MGYTSYTPDMVKRLKEGFVSNLDGTTMREIAAMSAVLPAFVLLRQCWPVPGGSKSKNENSTEDKESTSNFWRSLALDFLVIVVPTVACLTILADWIYTILAVVIGLLFVVLNFQRLQSSSAVGTTSVELDASRKTYLSSYRFVMMLVTCVTILAIDFTVFPRRYGKTETYGTGLMDIGVGSFVVANALVSRQARNLPPSYVSRD